MVLMLNAASMFAQKTDFTTYDLVAKAGDVTISLRTTTTV